MEIKTNFKRCGKQIIRESEEFGSGGIGHVHLARKEGEDKEGEKRLYVIKFPKKNPNIEQIIKKSFDQEIEILYKFHLKYYYF